MASLQKANQVHQRSYGDDEWSKKAILQFQSHFGDNCKVFFALTGTAANILSIQACCKSFEGVICSAEAHINNDECGGPEKIAGVKLLLVEPNKNGKITIEGIKKYCTEGIEENVHVVQPKLISISQCTEAGTAYTCEEIREICKFAHERNMYVHMDGARISNAAAFLNLKFREFTSDVGIDIISFGGTKNGLMIGEAVLVLNSQLEKGIAFHRKQNGYLFSKMRFVAAQFVALFEDDLWRMNAQHSNSMAKLLYEKLVKLSFVNVVYPVEGNEIFAIIPKEISSSVQKIIPFYIWNESKSMIRLVASFDTTEQDINLFIEHLIASNESHK